MKCIIRHKDIQDEIEIDELSSVIVIDLDNIPDGFTFASYMEFLKDTGILIVDSKGKYNINRSGKGVYSNKKGNIINHF